MVMPEQPGCGSNIVPTKELKFVGAVEMLDTSATSSDVRARCCGIELASSNKACRAAILKKQL